MHRESYIAGMGREGISTALIYPTIINIRTEGNMFLVSLLFYPGIPERIVESMMTLNVYVIMFMLN